MEMEKDTRPYVSFDLIVDFMKQAFVKLGVPEEDAAICADVLIESDKRGIESHGVNSFQLLPFLMLMTEWEWLQATRPWRWPSKRQENTAQPA